MNHVIGKQRIELQLSPDLEAYLLQQQFSQIYWQELVPEMEKMFNELSPNNELYILARLEIDLGQIKPTQVSAEYVIPLLKKELEKWFQQHQAKPDVLQKKSLPQGIFEKWLFFLQHGYLPWNAAALPENWMGTILENVASQSLAVRQLQQLVANIPFTKERLIQQHTPVFLQQLLAAFSAKPQAALVDFVIGLDNSPEQEAFWQYALQEVVVHQKKWDDQNLLKNYLDNNNVSKTFEAEIKKELTDNMDSTKPESHDIFVQNAGIILLHPFLNRFFEKLGLLENKNFKDQKAVAKAIHLLHYLATTEETPPEYELVLLKFLCGLPLKVPVRKNSLLREEEKEEADALLQAVIQHWGALGQVSNLSLQETFLQRDGKLVYEQTGWRLQIEKKTLDMLLDRLPWNISHIQLPWMNELLRVDWI